MQTGGKKGKTGATRQRMSVPVQGPAVTAVRAQDWPPTEALHVKYP